MFILICVDFQNHRAMIRTKNLIEDFRFFNFRLESGRAKKADTTVLAHFV